MSYIDNVSLKRVKYVSPNQVHKSRTYLEKSKLESTKLIKVEYASKKTSVTRIRYDLRKLNTY